MGEAIPVSSQAYNRKRTQDWQAREQRRHNPAIFLFCKKQSILIHCTGAADVFRSGSGAQDNSFTDVIQTGADGHSHPAKVHTDEGSADIHTGICLDGFHCHRIFKGVPCRYRKAAAGMGLGITLTIS